MFDPGLMSEPSAEKQRAAVAAVVRRAIDDGTFTYTDLLCAAEPMRTFALEHLDGVKVQGTIPVYQQHEAVDWDGAKLKLVHVEPKGRIRHHVMKDVRIPGTNRIKKDKVSHDFGNVAEVSDTPGIRLARHILVTKGWPMLQQRGSQIGTVVEWRWLEKEVRAEVPIEGARELYEEIMTRPEFSGAAESQSKATIKAPADKRAGVSP